MRLSKTELFELPKVRHYEISILYTGFTELNKYDFDSVSQESYAELKAIKKWIHKHNIFNNINTNITLPMQTIHFDLDIESSNSYDHKGMSKLNIELKFELLSYSPVTKDSFTLLQEYVYNLVEFLPEHTPNCLISINQLL
jgi:hypothetical protein